MAKDNRKLSELTQARTDEVLARLRGGYLRRKDNLPYFVNKWQCSDRTVDRILRKAKKIYLRTTESIRAKTQAEYEVKEVSNFLAGVTDKNKQAEYLMSKIAALEKIKAGKALQVGEGLTARLIIATHSDEIRASIEIRAILKQIGDWYGYNSPIAGDLEITVTDI